MEEVKYKTWISWAILAVLAIVWGSSFILIKKGLDVLDPVEVGALRIFIASLFLLPFVFGKLRGLGSRQLLYLALVGTVGSFLPAFLFAFAQKGLDSAMAGILNSLTPLFTLLVGFMLAKVKVKWFNVAGILLGLGGAVALLSSSGGKSLGFNLGYAVYILVATFFYAINVNLIKFYLREVPAVTITAVSFFFIGWPALIVLLFFTGFTAKLEHPGMVMEGVAYIAILSILGTGAALMLFNKLIKIASPLFASSVTYLIPVVALIWGFIDGEMFRGIYFLWIAMILFGVFLVNKRSLAKSVRS